MDAQYLCSPDIADPRAQHCLVLSALWLSQVMCIQRAGCADCGTVAGVQASWIYDLAVCSCGARVLGMRDACIYVRLENSRARLLQFAPVFSMVGIVSHDQFLQYADGSAYCPPNPCFLDISDYFNSEAVIHSVDPGIAFIYQ